MNDIQKSILETLSIKEDGMPRSEICDITKIPRTTIYDNLVKLEKSEIIERFSKSNGYRGRPLIYWKLKGDND